MFQLLGQIARSRITRDFVVFYALGGPDQSKVSGGIILVLRLSDDFFAFFDDAHHSLTRLPPRSRAKTGKALFESPDLLFGFLKMLFEAPLKLRSARSLHHLRQGFDELFFRMEDVSQLVYQKLLNSLGFAEFRTFSMNRHRLS